MTTFSSVACVGMHFRGALAVETAAALEPGALLTLEREPDNAYDAYAIKVMLNDIHLGYIERGQACWISPYMDEGGEPTCTVMRLETRRNNVHPILEITFDE